MLEFLSALSPTTWKITTVVFAVLALSGIVFGGVRSCDSSRKETARLEEINQLQKSVHDKELDIADMNKRLEGLRSELQRQEAVIVSKDAELDALRKTYALESEAIDAEKQITESVRDAVKSDPETCSWFDQEIPATLLDVLNQPVSLPTAKDSALVKSTIP